MKLYCVAHYRNHALHVNSRQHSVVARPGDVLDLDDALAEQVERDAPNCFHKTETKTFKAIAKNPGKYADRQMRSGGAVSEVMSTENMPGIAPGKEKAD